MQRVGGECDPYDSEPVVGDCAGGMGAELRVQLVVQGVVTVRSVRSGGNELGDLPDGTTIRGAPGSIGSEYTRSGPTDAFQAEWIEAGLLVTVVGRGVGEPELQSVLEATDFEDGLVTTAPSVWKLLGAAWAVEKPEGTTLGFTEQGAPLDESGIAPVEVIRQARPLTETFRRDENLPLRRV